MLSGQALSILRLMATGARKSSWVGRPRATIRLLATGAPAGQPATKPAASRAATPNAAKSAKGGTNANKAKKAKGGSEKQASESLTKFLTAAEEAKAFKPKFSEEELAEHATIARTYQRKLTELNNKLGKDLTNKIWLQQEALRAMPDNLRAKAEQIDDTPPPPDRPWPLWDTPPVKDFDAKQFTGRKGDEGEEEIVA